MTRWSAAAAICGVVALVGAGCSSSDALEDPPDVEADLLLPFLEDLPPVPPIDQALARVGRESYAAVCASCHGVELEGSEDWKTPDSLGQYPPPPLNSEGHAWHHPTALLRSIIHDGSPVERSAMTGFASRLSDDDIEAVIEYLKSTWGPQERGFQWAVDQGSPE